MRTALFWDFTKRRIVVSYRRFGENYQSHIQGSDSPRRPLKMGPICCRQTSVGRYRLTLRKFPQERSSQIDANILQTSLPCSYKFLQKQRNVKFNNALVRFLQFVT